MSTILGLREFTHMRWDPRILIVDARDNPFALVAPLDNPFFAWIRIRSEAQLQRLVGHICGRHLIIVHEDEERALDLDHRFKGLELHSWALEAGERGWRNAIVEESAETLGDVLVVTLNRLAFNKRQYLLVHDRHAVAVQPSGSLPALLEELRYHGAVLDAVADIEEDGSEGLATAALLGVPYVNAPFEVGSINVHQVDHHRLRLQTHGSLPSITLYSNSAILPAM